MGRYPVFYVRMTTGGEIITAHENAPAKETAVTLACYPTDYSARQAAQRLIAQLPEDDKPESLERFRAAIQRERMRGEYMIAAYRLARGNHQRAVVEGKAVVGGPAREGIARKSMMRYGRSVENLLDRLDRAGIPYHIQYGPRGGWYSARVIVGRYTPDEPDRARVIVGRSTPDEPDIS